MYRGATIHTLGSGLIAALLVFAANACGGGKEVHTIPPAVEPLASGKYATDVFEPGMSFSVGKGWISMIPETREAMALGEENGPMLMGILNVEMVFDPSRPEAALKPAPDDMEAWLQEHPRLDVEEPSRVTVGGVSGQQFDAIVTEPTEGFQSCTEPCVPLFDFTKGNFWMGETEKYRFVVLDNVDGKTVTIFFGGPSVEFEESLPKAQEVLNTIEWEDA